MVFSDSYEEAMQNFLLPETDAFSRRMMALGGCPPVFYNLEATDIAGKRELSPWHVVESYNLCSRFR